MLFSILPIFIGAYSVVGIFTSFLKRNEIKAFAVEAVPHIIKELGADKAMQLEMSGISIENVAIFTGHILCMVKWPSYIHSNVYEIWTHNIGEK